MTIGRTLLELTNVVTAMEIAQEKAHVVSGDLSQEYFDLADGYKIQYYHDHAGVMNSISLDYIFEMKKLIEDARRLSYSAFEAVKAQEQMKEPEDKEKSPQSPSK